jgi:hypothetical protein
MIAALPQHARQRLSQLRLQQMSADDLARGCNTRLNALGRDPDRELQSQLTAERDKHAERFRQLSLLIGKVNEWVMRLPANTMLEVVQAADIKLKENETWQQAIGNVRGGIVGLQKQLDIVRKAPLPRLAQQEAISEYLSRLAQQQARLKVVFDVQGNARVIFADDVVASKDDVLGLLSFVLGPQQLAAAFARFLEQEPERADALSANEKNARESELRNRLLEHEQREEALIMAAHDQGIEIIRRVDASPACVLGVVIAKARTTQEVA